MVNNVQIDLEKIASTPGPSNYNASNKYNNLSSTKKAPSYSIHGKNYSKTKKFKQISLTNNTLINHQLFTSI